MIILLVKKTYKLAKRLVVYSISPVYFCHEVDDKETSTELKNDNYEKND